LGITNLTFLADESLTITGFTAHSAIETQFTYPTCISIFCGVSINTGFGSLTVPGEDLPFEIGTMTINNNGNGPGHVILVGAQYTDTNFNNYSLTPAPQTTAVAAPEPGTLLLIGVGVGGLVAVRSRRKRTR
jgi:hypothetical protein